MNLEQRRQELIDCLVNCTFNVTRCGYDIKGVDRWIDRVVELLKNANTDSTIEIESPNFEIVTPKGFFTGGLGYSDTDVDAIIHDIKDNYNDIVKFVSGVVDDVRRV